MKAFLLAAWLSGCTADAVTTCGVLDRGGREVVLTQHCGVNAAIITGEAGVGVWGFRSFSRTHPKVAIGLGIVLTGFRVAVAARNARIR